jgi:hypothetical protein
MKRINHSVETTENPGLIIEYTEYDGDQDEIAAFALQLKGVYASDPSVLGSEVYYTGLTGDPDPRHFTARLWSRVYRKKYTPEKPA